MEAIGEDLAGSAHHAVQSTRDSDAEALHAARECGAIVGFDDEVEVIVLPW